MQVLAASALELYSLVLYAKFRFETVIRSATILFLLGLSNQRMCVFSCKCIDCAARDGRYFLHWPT